jgi:hypothetical protein
VFGSELLRVPTVLFGKALSLRVDDEIEKFVGGRFAKK